MLKMHIYGPHPSCWSLQIKGVYSLKVPPVQPSNEISTLPEGTGAKSSVVGRLSRVVRGASERGVGWPFGPALFRDRMSVVPVTTQQTHVCPHDFPLTCALVLGLDTSFGVTGNTTPLN